MDYALTITLAAVLAFLVLVGLLYLGARRVAGASVPSLSGWSWYPSPIALLLVLPLAGLLLWRLFPAFLLLPVLLPFFLRLRLFGRNRRRGRRDGDDGTFEGHYRRIDD